jgi:cytochrome c oxidase subunit II
LHATPDRTAPPLAFPARQRGDVTVRSPDRRADRAARPRRRPARVALPLALVLLLSACAGEQTMLDPQGYYARRPDELFRVTFWIAVVVFVLVQGLVIYAAVRFRAKDDDDELPVQVHGNTRLEVVWTVIPALILAAIAVPTVQQIFELDAEPEDAMVVEVIGHRWWWEFRYPDYGITTANEMVIPVDRNIRLEMTSFDVASSTGVIHSFWIPALAGKQDVIPGRITTLNMVAEAPGRYIGMCTEYCGLSHANMRQRAIAVPQSDFDSWVAEQQQGAAVPADGSQEATGRDLFANHCAACHNIREAAASGPDAFANATGPDLTHLMSRKEFAGAIFDLYLREDPNDPNSPHTDTVDVDLLRAWVEDAPSLKAMRPEQGYSMIPFTNLSDAELDAIVAYLLTLR